MLKLLGEISGVMVENHKTVRTPCVVNIEIQVKKESMSCSGVALIISIQAIFVTSLVERSF